MDGIYMCFTRGAYLCSSCFTFLLENGISITSVQKFFSFYTPFCYTLHMIYCF
uniref:Uncharacterized protein n=1 Tax=Aegilops tauschii subsp. strangulata TaxID=200361 RepID=A0A453RQK1_AEGTS